MKYVAWLWRNMAGMRFNAAVRIVFGVARVALGLLMVCLSKHFIDVTIKTGSNEDIVEMIVLLVPAFGRSSTMPTADMIPNLSPSTTR